jgi:hypothetical protein
MKSKYKKYTNEYMLYLRLRHIYGKGAGFGEDITFMKIKDRWKKLYKYQKERDNENCSRILHL